MSTRLSTEELDAFDETLERAGAHLTRDKVKRLVAEVRESWDEREAARRALSGLLAMVEMSPDYVAWDYANAPQVLAARAVLPKNGAANERP